MTNAYEALEQQVVEYAHTHALFVRDAVVYVAVSGGADSMVLLRLLLCIAPSLAITVRACHVNHGLRGVSADADEAFVRAECARLAVPLTVFSVCADGTVPPAHAGEAWAREVRYGYFERLFSEDNVFVATAHTLNDQAETLLFRLARGTGVHGAAGIQPHRGHYLRPLLSVTRAQVEAYCAQHNVPYVTDETNLQINYARNHLRQHALPSLCCANQGAVQHLGQFCEKMMEIDDYFASLASELLMQAQAKQPNVFSLVPLRNAHPLVLSAAMYQLVCPLRDPETKYTEALCALVQEGSGAVQLTTSARFVAKDGFLRLLQSEKTDVKLSKKVEYYPVVPAKYTFPSGYNVILERISLQNTEKIQLVHKKDLKNYADYDKIVSSLVLRTRMQGDTFAPAGRGVTKTIKKLHNELGIPQAQRAQMPLLADGNVVVWLWGQGFAEGYAPCENTKTFLKITEEKNAEESNDGFNHG